MRTHALIASVAALAFAPQAMAQAFPRTIEIHYCFGGLLQLGNLDQQCQYDGVGNIAWAKIYFGGAVDLCEPNGLHEDLTWFKEDLLGNRHRVTIDFANYYGDPGYQIDFLYSALLVGDGDMGGVIGTAQEQLTPVATHQGIWSGHRVNNSLFDDCVAALNP